MSSNNFATTTTTTMTTNRLFRLPRTCSQETPVQQLSLGQPVLRRVQQGMPKIGLETPQRPRMRHDRMEEKAGSGKDSSSLSPMSQGKWNRMAIAIADDWNEKLRWGHGSVHYRNGLRTDRGILNIIFVHPCVALVQWSWEQKGTYHKVSLFGCNKFVSNMLDGLAQEQADFIRSNFDYFWLSCSSIRSKLQILCRSAEVSAVLSSASLQILALVVSLHTVHTFDF